MSAHAAGHVWPARTRRSCLDASVDRRAKRKTGLEDEMALQLLGFRLHETPVSVGQYFLPRERSLFFLDNVIPPASTYK